MGKEKDFLLGSNTILRKFAPGFKSFFVIVPIRIISKTRKAP